MGDFQLLATIRAEYAAGGQKYEPNAEIAFPYFTSNMEH